MLPEFLHDRPDPFIKHCVEKIGLAKFIGGNRIKCIDDIDFTVTSLQENGTKEYTVTKEYKVVLTNNNAFPSSECANWKKNMLPCKHMFAIFEKIDGLDSVNYPYFCILIPHTPTCENEDPELVSKLAYFNALPKKQYARRSKASVCRELLNQINSLTFLVLEEETLDKLEEDLKDITEDLKL